MIFEYVCKECKKITEYHKSYKEVIPPTAIKCEHCGDIATKRPFGGNIIIPESFKSK